MCGIVGFAQSCQSSDTLEDQAILKTMGSTLTHRGPDAEGYYRNQHVALGHRRLSIIDHTGGAQPMRNTENGQTIVFNGEIYNYLKLNGELEASGHAPQTRSDTETLLNAYTLWGDDCLEKLNGMFAFVVYDQARKKLFGARDRMGQKPLYYYHSDSFFAFASEPKALLKHPRVPGGLDMEAAARYLMYEFVPAPYAIYKGMKKLEAGQCFQFDLETGQLTLRHYWDHTFSVTDSNDETSEKDWAQQVHAKLNSAVERRLISDVPLGVFLSGGIDSSSIAAMYAKGQGQKDIKTFSIGFKEKSFDETEKARELAGFLGAEHHEEQLDPSACLEILPVISELLDEPFADPSILPTYLLAKFARKYVTVVLGGDGGDELFSGYPTYHALPWAKRYNACVPRFLHQHLVQPLSNALPVSDDNFSFDYKVNRFLRGVKQPENERLWRWLGAFAPEELLTLLTPEATKQINPEKLYSEIHDLNQNAAAQTATVRDSYIFAKTYLADGVLQKVDRATMACSLEARSPLLDPDLVSLADRIPANLKVNGTHLKYIFKKAVEDLLPKNWLQGPKKGFGIPTGPWLRGPLKPLLLETLDRKRLERDGLFKAATVKKLIDEHLDGKRNHRKALWTLFMFQRWQENWGG